MPTETIIFLAITLLAFGSFMATLIITDLRTAEARRKHNPIPGE